jgi:hypothetical protein
MSLSVRNFKRAAAAATARSLDHLAGGLRAWVRVMSAGPGRTFFTCCAQRIA